MPDEGLNLAETSQKRTKEQKKKVAKPDNEDNIIASSLHNLDQHCTLYIPNKELESGVVG